MTLLKKINQLKNVTDLCELENNIFLLFMKITKALGGSLIEFDGRVWRALSIKGNQFLLEHSHCPLQVHLEGPLQHTLDTGKPFYISQNESPLTFHPSGYDGYQGTTALIFPLFHYPNNSVKFITLHSPKKNLFSFSDFNIGKNLLQLVDQILQFFFIKKSVLPVDSQKNPDLKYFYDEVIKNRTFLHNLRNIVFPLSICLPFLNSQPQGTPRWKQAFSNMGSCMEHLLHLVRSPAYEKKSMSDTEGPTPLHLPTLFRKCASMIPSKPFVCIDCHFDQFSNDEFWFWGFKNEMEQMILNLLKNAMEAMADKGKITLFFEKVNPSYLQKNNGSFVFQEYVSVTIKDYGEGMDEETLRKIFTPGFTTKSTGSGIGLASVYQTLKRHQAFVDVKSVKGEGTIFCLIFPSIKSMPKERFLKAPPQNHIRL